MALTNGQHPLYATAGAGLHQQNFASASGGDGFEWDPSGVTFGVDLTTDRVFDGQTVTNDLITVFGGAFDPNEVTASGMAVFDGNPNHPDAIGDLLTKLQTLDYTLVIHWRQHELFQFGDQPLAFFYDDLENWLAVVYLENAVATYATNGDGDFNDVGAPRAFSDNVIAVSFNGDGLLASLNGATAVLSTPAAGTPVTRVVIGHDGSNTELEGWIKALIFYPATNAAGVEAYAANAAPTNSAMPVITGTFAEGQTMSVSTGTWTGSPTSYQYQWYVGTLNGFGILTGETANTLLVQAGWPGQDLFCVVYATNADGIGGVAAQFVP